MVKNWKKELIGETIEIIGSKNKTLIGVKGKIVEETKNTITLDNEKKILKSHIVLKIGDEVVDGKTIKKRPEDRIKK
jgi:ribonuclease P protein subunit POP4